MVGGAAPFVSRHDVRELGLAGGATRRASQAAERRRFLSQFCCPAPCLSMTHFHFSPSSRPAHAAAFARNTASLRSDRARSGQAAVSVAMTIDTATASIPARFLSASASRAWGNRPFGDDVLELAGAHSLMGA